MKTAVDFTRAIERIENLHSNMPILSRLQTMLRDENTELFDAGRLLRSDAPLCAQIVRISNSLIYRRGGFSSDLQEAIQKVGFQDILKMVGLALSKGLFFRELPGYGITAREYWQQSYFAALFMERLAPRLKLEADEAYLIGLLHMIGKVVIESLLADENIEVHWDASIPRGDWEMMLVGFRYDEAGALLLEKWGFPPTLTRRIGRQNKLPGDPPEMGVFLLQFTTVLMDNNRFETPLNEWTLCPEHSFWRYTRMTSEALRSDLSRVLETLNKTRTFLDSI